MVNAIKINQLPEGSGNLSLDDLFVFMDNPSSSGVTKKITLNQIANIIGSGGSGLSMDEIKDNLGSSFFSAGSGIALNYNNTTNVLTIDNTQTSQPPTTIYPIRAYVFGGLIVLNNISDDSFNSSVSILYNWGLSPEDIKHIGTINYPDTSITVDCNDSVVKAVADNPDTYPGNVSLEVALVDNANRIVGWAITSTNEAHSPTHGSAGYTLTMNVFDFPDITGIPDVWIITSASPDTNKAGYLFNQPSEYANVDLPETTLLNRGLVTGNTTIDGNYDIQIVETDGTATTFQKGDNWYGSGGYAKDVVLKIIATAPTVVNWDFVDEWYNQPTSSTLGSGTHQFVLRLVNQNTIEGHYIGLKTS